MASLAVLKRLPSRPQAKQHPPRSELLAKVIADGGLDLLDLGFCRGDGVKGRVLPPRISNCIKYIRRRAYSQRGAASGMTPLGLISLAFAFAQLFNELRVDRFR